MVMKVDEIKGQVCPVCRKKALTLTEAEENIPHFGKVYLFSMSCSECKYSKADVECAETNDPTRYEIEVSDEKDMSIKIVKSSTATVKIPHVGSMEPGVDSNGFITNIEGLLNRFADIIKHSMGNEEDQDVRKKVKNLLKKINRVVWGREKLKIIIEDPCGNSAILSDKTKKTALKK